jgi:sensor histidine kinase YesM
MILQPIVENSFIHGISEMPDGGDITLLVTRSNNIVYVEIADNGCGMSRDIIEKILSDNAADILVGHDSGQKKNCSIGLKNVISRLMLFYHENLTQNIVEIESEIGVGTKIILKLPIKRQECP